MSSTVSLRFEDGEIFNAWERFTFRESFVDPLGSLDLTARPPRALISKYAARLQKGQRVQLFVNDRVQGRYLIQAVRVGGGREGISFDVSCESPLCTPYEASAPPDYAFSSKTDVPISSVIMDLMRPFGFTEIYVNADDDVAIRAGKKFKSDKITIAIDSLKHQDCQVQENETVYGVIDRIVNRLGMILRVDVEGRLLLVRPRYDQAPGYTLTATFQNTVAGNRMLDGWEVESTNKGQFSEYVVRGVASDKAGQKSTSQPVARVGVSDPPADRGPYPFEKTQMVPLEAGPHLYSSPEIAPHKPKYFREKKTRDNQRAQSLCKLLAGMKAKEAFVVSCEVPGFVAKEEALYTVDTVARVVVDAIELDTPMWILERTFVLDRMGGERTQLKLIPRHSLIIGDLPS